MREPDFGAFGAMLDAVCSLLSRGAYVPSPANTAMFFRALARYSIDEVRAGFDAHVADPQRGRFVPVPADIIAQLEGLAADDGRPGAEEAWAVALRAADEADTVVWTAEAAQAWTIARPVWDGGDEVGARMAFKEAYTRLVDEARRRHMPPAWQASLGFDTKRRDQALAEAVHAGRLPGSELPALAGPGVPLLAMASTVPMPERAREALLALGRALRERCVGGPSADELARAATARLKAEVDARVTEYREGAA